MFRLKLLSLVPFLSRWIEATPAAYCGVCPTCIGTAVSGVLLPIAVKKSPEAD
jgi:hypothetical protein